MEELGYYLSVTKADNTSELIFSVAEQNCAMHGVNTLGLASLSYLSKLGQGTCRHIVILLLL